MQLAARMFTLELAEPFVISRSSDTESEVVQVAIRHGDQVGYGEGAPDPRYGENCQSALEFFDQAQPLLGDDPFALEAIEAGLATMPGQMAARCAIDGALHDLIGKLCDQPLWRLFGLQPGAPPPRTRSRSTRSRALPTAPAAPPVITPSRSRSAVPVTWSG